MKDLLSKYHHIEKKTFEDIIDFHYQFKIIHPFQDDNGRAGRLIMFKECLASNIVLFTIQAI
ncbi:Fic family protein [Sphingobacterium kitahiroshimense]|uniref:Fic family protein n=1 Tax=Sphingobacterium kitahiroshimense TaxID=470446 RepID=A0ABV0BW36_9SPHI